MPPFSDDIHQQQQQLQQEQPIPSYPGSPASVIKPRPVLAATQKQLQPIDTIQERKVAFFPRVVVNYVPDLSSYTPEEIERTWFSEDELQKIERDAVRVARRMMRRTLRKTDCPRGLETYTTPGIQETRRNRINAMFAVLSQQQILLQDIHSPQREERIAHAYMAVSAVCKLHALDRAILDAIEAKKYQDEDPYASDPLELSKPLNCWFFDAVQQFLQSLRLGNVPIM